jgi:S1-C subfamily serine protease
MNRRSLVLLTLLLLSAIGLSGCGASSVSLPSLVSGVVEGAQAGGLQAPVLSQAGVLDALEETLQGVYEQVNPSVVNIRVAQDAAQQGFGMPGVPGLPSVPSLPEDGLPLNGQGSGFVWDQSGHIVTNNHVVANAERIRVTFWDDTTVMGTVVGTDPNSDLALIKVDVPAEKLFPVEVGDSTAVHVGELAVAIGNPFGLEGTMTVGFVSALGRSLPVSGSFGVPSYAIPDIIQTDAPINPGNSGGVLVGDDGLLIGVPTAIESPVQANAGIGFAVPAAIVQKVVPSLIETGAYEHPWLGVSGTTLSFELAEAMDLEPDQRGVMVAEVLEGSPAREAGLQGSAEKVAIDGIEVDVGGDIIVAIDGEPVRGFDDLVTYLSRSTEVGQTVTLTVLRDGSEEQASVVLAARPVEEELAVPASAPQGQVPAPPGFQSPFPGDGAWLGIMGRTLTTELAAELGYETGRQGALVEEVLPNGPADRAGLRGGSGTVALDGYEVRVGGDLITAFDGHPVSGFEALKSHVEASSPGQEVELGILRDGEQVELQVTLGQRQAAAP